MISLHRYIKENTYTILECSKMLGVSIYLTKQILNEAGICYRNPLDKKRICILKEDFEDWVKERAKMFEAGFLSVLNTEEKEKLLKEEYKKI